MLTRDTKAAARLFGRRRRAVVGLLTATAALFATPGAADAHPLGNFSVNRLHTLTITDDRIIDDLVVDAAEIPTTQLRPDVDNDGDGVVTVGERTSYAEGRCSDVAGNVTLTVGGASVGLAPTEWNFSFEEGQAGLETSRLECRLEADVVVAPGSGLVDIDFVDDHETGRVGWNEINAVGDGVAIVDAPVPTSSVTDGLRSYPVDLLESPLDIRAVTLSVDPDGVSMAATESASVDGDGSGGAASARDDLVESRPGFFDGTVGRVQDAFDDLVGRRDLTIEVGVLAMGLALVLGAAHAMLPGHGKTVMAAYIAGRQGSSRDAVVVGATVTATHTGGVLLLGTALTVSSSLAGEGVLAWLGVISGLLIAGLGLGLLVSAIRRRDDGFFGHGHSHGPGGHHHHDHPDGHGHHHHHHDHDHDDHPDDADAPDVVQLGASDRQPAGRQTSPANVAVLERRASSSAEPDEHVHDHDHDHSHDHAHDHHHPHRVSRRGLVGMGVAGGLVPSPSALIILLSAIALGRTWFGVLLVVGYGVGMAATLTAAGVLLVVLRDRSAGMLGRANGRLAAFGRRWSRIMPHLTALLVLVVGLGLALRGLADI